jgi:hypothetical protein
MLVIPWLGIPGPWKERKGGVEWSGKCPLRADVFEVRKKGWKT